ncbi:hypothetical protein ACUC2M_15105 [Bacillus cytotoxicus]
MFRHARWIYWNDCRVAYLYKDSLSAYIVQSINLWNVIVTVALAILFYIIETALSKDRSTYHFIVQDNGQGIPNETIAEITELPYSSKKKTNDSRRARPRHSNGSKNYAGAPRTAYSNKQRKSKRFTSCYGITFTLTCLSKTRD